MLKFKCGITVPPPCRALLYQQYISLNMGVQSDMMEKLIIKELHLKSPVRKIIEQLYQKFSEKYANVTNSHHAIMDVQPYDSSQYCIGGK